MPIPVFYYNESGEPLVDPAILEHVECLFQEYGSDCWWSMEIEELLPESFKHQANLLRKGPDTMDVWFDSGVSWISALLPRGVNIPVDLVVEGSDQHRGWFQSSLLTSMASTGTPSYKAILSHGFVLDEKLQKMSKSLGNVISPSEIILGKWKQNKDLSGAELLRLWAASTDFTNDVTIGPLILSKCSTTLRKCRNTLRFLLSALNDYVPKDNHSLVDVSSFPPVEQYILKSLLEFASKAESGYEKFEFCRVVKLIENFVSNDLSAFYFTVSKDTLYCQSKDSILRLNTQHAMMEILSVLTKVISPILPHLAQEVFNNLPERLRPFLGYSENELESLFTCGWVDIKRYSSLERVDFESWKSIFRLRAIVLQKLEKSRADGIFSGDFSNASVSLRFSKQYPCPSMNILDQLLDNDQLNAFFGVSHVEICKESMSSKVDLDERIQSSDAIDYSWSESEVMIASAKGTKCFRCWRICQDTQPKEIAGESCEICHRCRKVMDTLDWNQV